MRTFVYSDDKSNKFWNIDLKGKSFTVQFGRIGTTGQTQTKDFPDAKKAHSAHDKLIAEKIGKGYTETTNDHTPAPVGTGLTTIQQMLEKAILENPLDLAAQSAYADYLIEQDDPRGELIQVQLALEDDNRSVAERKTLRIREKTLLKKVTHKILGKLAPLLDGEWCAPDKPYHYTITRGWLSTLRTLPFPSALIDALADTPETCMLERLEIVYDMKYHPFDFESVTAGLNNAIKKMTSDDSDNDEFDSDMYDEAQILPALIDSPYLTRLRAFKLGFSDIEDDYAHSTMVPIFNNCNSKNVLQLIEKCPHLEELYINTHIQDINTIFAYTGFDRLKVFQYYYGEVDYRRNRDRSYPLSELAKNKSLRNITTLNFHPGREAILNLDDVTALLESKNLPNLTHLQLHMTTFGDGIVERLIDSKIMRRLKVLDIGYGNLTDEGARELAACADLKKLELLKINRNALTTRGIAFLKATGVAISGDTHQHDAEDTDYLYEVDRE